MPHERGPSPVLPSEFSLLPSPIPKLASAARRLPIDIRQQGIPPILLTREHLVQIDARSTAAWPSRSYDHLCPLTLNIRRAMCGFRPICEKRIGPKRRATSIVARPGLSCKSRAEST